MSDRSGAELVAACLEGDQTAFSEIVGRYHKQVYNAAYRIAGSRADAEDVSQAVFLRVYERLDRFDPSYRLFSWVYKICVNESLNLLAKRRSAGPIDLELADSKADPERRARGREIGRAIEQALQQLTPEHRVMIVLRHFRDLTYDEISEVVEIPVKTVKSRLFSARRELRRILDARHLR